MHKHLLYITLFSITSALAFGACADEMDSTVTPDVPEMGEKTPIEISIGGVEDLSTSVTRAEITQGKTYQSFDKNAKVFILMMSEKDTETHGGYEYKGDRTSPLYTVSRGDVTAGNNNVVLDNENKKYWDDAHARSSQITMWAIAQKVADSAVDGRWKNITFQKINGNDSDKPGISDASDAGYNTTIRNEWQGTSAVYPAIFSWSVGNLSDAHQNQDEKTIIYQDLLFSNNISFNSQKSWADNRLKFGFTTDHKFPSANLNFHHAMSKITIKLIAGEGFKKDGTDFTLANGTSIDKLIGFNTQGLFNIKDGEFQTIHKHADITKIPCTTNANSGEIPYYTLEFLAIPNIHEFLKGHNNSDTFSRFISGKKSLETDVMMEFTIDHNTYKITSDALFDALMQHNDDGTQKDNAIFGATKKTGSGEDDHMGTYIPLEAGKNYVFTFRVSKTKVSGITAQVVNWETVVAAEQTPSNARITLSLDGRGTAKETGVAFYRALNENTSVTIDDSYTSYDWIKQYSKAQNVNYSSGQWTTEWYWPNNKSFYHFRAISPATTTVTTSSDTDNYFTLASADATSSSYNEIAWGAPFYENKEGETNKTFTYSITKGFDGTGAEPAENKTHQIHKAIGPTDSQIKLLMFHMMSGVHFTIITETETDATNKVELYNGSATNQRPKVQLVGYLPTGKVYMGDGHVVADGTPTTTSDAGIICRTTATGQYGQQDYYYSAVPQALTGATDADPGVQLYITTPDNNQYIVNLKDVLATSVSHNNITNPYTEVSTTNGTRYEIDRWYPGFQYNYTLKLTKKGIDDITATIVNWETVEATYDDVQIQ